MREVEAERLLSFLRDEFQGIIGEFFGNIRFLRGDFFSINNKRTVEVSPLSGLNGEGNKLIDSSQFREMARHMPLSNKCGVITCPFEKLHEGNIAVIPGSDIVLHPMGMGVLTSNKTGP